MIEVKITTHSPMEKKVFLVQSLNNVKALEDGLIYEAQRLFGHQARNILDRVDDELYDTIFDFNKIPKDKLDGINIEAALKEVLDPKDTPPLNRGDKTLYLREALFEFLSGQVVNNDQFIHDSFNSRYNRASIASACEDYTEDSVLRISLLLDIQLGETFAKVKQQKPEFSKLLENFNFFKLTEQLVLKEISNACPIKVAFSLPEKIVVIK